MPLVTREGKELWYREDVYGELMRGCQWRAWIYGLGGLLLFAAIGLLMQFLEDQPNIPAWFGFLCGAWWCHAIWVQLWQIRALERKYSLYPKKTSGFLPPSDETDDQTTRPS